MKLSYRHTVAASFIGYVVQAIVNIFVPLLFVTFQAQYNIPLSEITVLIAVNFAVQLSIDFSSAFFIDKMGYRAAALVPLLVKNRKKKKEELRSESGRD